MYEQGEPRRCLSSFNLLFSVVFQLGARPEGPGTSMQNATLNATAIQLGFIRQLKRVTRAEYI